MTLSGRLEKKRMLVLEFHNTSEALKSKIQQVQNDMVVMFHKTKSGRVEKTSIVIC